MTLELMALMSVLVAPRKSLLGSDFQLESSGRLEAEVWQGTSPSKHKITKVTYFRHPRIDNEGDSNPEYA